MFNTGLGLALLCNAILQGVQLDYGTDVPAIQAIHYILLVTFCVEVCARIYAFRW